MSGQAYRPDIDGLRGIAVLAVVGFHLSESLLPAGYLGVDVFFVISGYLIGRIICAELDEGTFSYRHFYIRRLRRLGPALMAMLVVTTMVAGLLYLPRDLIGYSKSLWATLLFGSNIYFLRDTNYFAAIAEEKALLHMWSLSVEEQFYFLAPVLLVVLHRLRPRRQLIATTALVALSLGLHYALVELGKAGPAFYLLPTRMWELGMGICLALAQRARPWPVAVEKVGIAALLLLFVCLTYGAKAPVPLANLLACLATATLILAGHRAESPSSLFLGWRPLSMVGRASYSIYLWHWPLIVFCKYYHVVPLSPFGSGILLLGTVVIGFGSWRFIERPCRNPKVTTRSIATACLAAALLLAAAAAAAVFSGGLAGRVDDRAAKFNAAVGTHYRCELTNYLRFGPFYGCAVNLPSGDPDKADVLLYGNSHAQMYAPVLARVLAEGGRQGFLVPMAGCLPFVNFNISTQCLNLARANVAAINRQPSAGVLVIALFWETHYDLIGDGGSSYSVRDADDLIPLVTDLSEKTRKQGRKLYWVGPIAVPGVPLSSFAARNIQFSRGINLPLYADYSEFATRWRPLWRAPVFAPDNTLLRPDKIQCSEDVGCNYFINDAPLFSDSNHLAAAATMRFAEMFSPILSNGDDQILQTIAPRLP